MQRSPWVDRIYLTGIASPFAAASSVPLRSGGLLTTGQSDSLRTGLFPASWAMWLAHVLWSICLNGSLLCGMIWLFRTRWRVSQ